MSIIRNVAAIISFGIASTSIAAPLTVTVNGVPTVLGTVSDTFSGPAALSKNCFGIPINLNCTLTVDGTVSQSTDPNYADLTITAAASSGGGGLISCSDVSFNNLPWSGTAHHDDIIAGNAFPVGTVGVSTPCGSCSGNVNVSFSNTGNGEFAFLGTLGTCSVNGSGIDATSGAIYRISH